MNNGTTEVGKMIRATTRRGGGQALDEIDQEFVRTLHDDRVRAEHASTDRIGHARRRRGVLHFLVIRISAARQWSAA